MSGYLSFTHEQFDWMMKMSIELSKREYALLMVIIRFTHGFHRKEARLSASYIHAACGLRATHVPETLRKLQVRGVIQILPKVKNTNVVLFEWEQVLSTPPNSGVSTSPKTGGYPSQNGSKTPPNSGVKPSQFGREEKKEENKERNKDKEKELPDVDYLMLNGEILF